MHCFEVAKQYAAAQGIPLREVLERGVEAVLREPSAGHKSFRMKSITTRGKGLVRDGSWRTIRALIYEGHGG